LPAGARLTVQHIFRSAEDGPLEVIYSFPLPRDAALRRFRITGEGFEAHSELRQTEAAIKAYEEGLARGSLSTLARQHGDGVVNLTVGNIRPGEEITVHLELLAGVELRDNAFRFRFPFTLAPAYHGRARTVSTAPGEGEMELPSDEFGDVILPPFREDALALHQVGFELAVTGTLEVDEVGSPSHAVRVKRESAGGSRVALAAEKDIPNRDLVLDVHYRDVRPQVLVGIGPGGKGHFAAIVPSTCFGGKTEAPRRLVILLDRSGSMQGAPITQAAKAIDACLAALTETDSFGLVAFAGQVETCDAHLLPGTRENRERARAFLNAVKASGGTQLLLGFRKAVELLEREGGDVLILTDGQVAGTEQILAEARAANTRLHCLGIGSASQDRFLALLSRETGGVSRFVTASERVDLPAVDLFASIGRPVASGLRAQGNIQPEAPATVFSGTPVLLFGEAESAADSSIELSWDGGKLSLPVSFAGGESGDTVWLLQGARLITDWESRYPSVEALAPLEKRQQSRVGARLRDLSRTYGLASREMSLVAVVERADDRVGDLPLTRVVPVGMPQDTRFNAYFGTPRLARVASLNASVPRMAMPPSAPAGMGGEFSFSLFRMSDPNPAPRTAGPFPSFTNDDRLLALASAMESDGGMPGKNVELRAAATVVALFAFLANGHTLSNGAFRSHVARLVSFLQSLSGLPAHRQELTDAAISTARKGQTPAGDWLALAQTTGDHWREVARALAV
jgi:hypothetical protein